MFFENGIVKAFNLLYNNGGDIAPKILTATAELKRSKKQ